MVKKCCLIFCVYITKPDIQYLFEAIPFETHSDVDCFVDYLIVLANLKDYTIRPDDQIH